MINRINDKKYKFFVNDILENDEFRELERIEHHGTNRMDHSIRVSYYSYRITKLLGLDYKETARAGLLHDFFISDEDRDFKERFMSTFTHPKLSLENSKKIFKLSPKEENIIQAHMFPIYLAVPKYAESWIVTMVDKTVAAYEFSLKFGNKLNYVTNLFFMIIFNIMR